MCCTSVMKWHRKSFRELSCDIQVWEVGQRELGFGVINFVGEEILVLAQGDGVDLSTRFDLHIHQFGAIFGGKLEPCVIGYLAISCTLSEQEPSGWAMVSMLSVRITSMLSWECWKGVCQQ